MSDTTIATPTIESTMGALALAANESSWPSKAQTMLDAIQDLDPTLQPLMTNLVTGLMEAHANLMGMYIATRPFVLQVDPVIGDSIRKLKTNTGGGDTPDALREGFAAIEKAHAFIEEVFQADLSAGEDRITQARVAQGVHDALGAV
ncbi:MAG TPA: hypothetical protein VF705_08035 [Longimicrobium sp.]